jgi:hypothetical protein
VPGRDVVVRQVNGGWRREGESSEKLCEGHEPRETVVRTKATLRTATLPHRIEMRPGEKCWTLFIFYCADGPISGAVFAPDQSTR